jgi:hypothetical protein
MAKNNGLWIALGIGAAYYFLYSKSIFGSGTTTPTAYPPVPATPPGTPVGGFLSAIFPSVFGPNGTYTVAQIPKAAGGAVDVTNINQVGSQPAPINSSDYSTGCGWGGNVCDPTDCDYNEQLCQEMQGYTV